MVHERYDLRKWTRAFPLKDYPPARLKSEGAWAKVTGPAEMALVEQIREAARAKGLNLGPPVPTDACIWNLGDSPRRDVTKVGGVPFWPADEPWPYNGDDTPYTYVGQFCFADSLDIVPRLPGEILVILAESDEYQLFDFRWFRLEDDDLIAPDALPEPGWDIQPCYAALHRTAEYPASDCDLFDEYPGSWRYWPRRFTEATKIGGQCIIQGDLPDPTEIKDKKYRKSVEEAWEGLARMEREFLCELQSVSGSPLWPFLNVAPGEEPSSTKDHLCILDAGSIQLFYNGREVYEDVTTG